MLNLTQRREDAMDSGPAIRDSWGGSKQSVISGSVISKEPGARIQEPGDYAWGVSALRRSAAMMTQPKISSTYCSGFVDLKPDGSERALGSSLSC